jgi:hypothetical protein
MSMSIPIPNSEKKSDKVQGRDEEKLERCRKRLEAMLTAANASKEVSHHVFLLFWREEKSNKQSMN